MKKLTVFLVLVAVISTSAIITPLAEADIHEPPKMRFTASRKFGRGVSNIIYGWTEIPATMHRWGECGEQVTGIWTAGFFQGLHRAGVRMKFGIYEVVNFKKPLYKNSYRPPYASINYLPMINDNGYEEFPPQIGELSTVGYTRGRTW